MFRQQCAAHHFSESMGCFAPARPTNAIDKYDHMSVVKSAARQSDGGLFAFECDGSNHGVYQSGQNLDRDP